MADLGERVRIEGVGRERGWRRDVLREAQEG